MPINLLIACANRELGRVSWVGICTRRCPEMLVAMLATWKAGGAYLPLDPTYPTARLKFMLDDAAPAVLLTQAGLVSNRPEHAAEVICLDSWDSIQTESPAPPISNVQTARPGLCHLHIGINRPAKRRGPWRHRGLCNLVQAQREAFGLDPSDRVLQFASLSFDASIFEIVMALANGATLVLASEDCMLPGPGLAAQLRDHQITAVTLPPSVLAAMPTADLPALRQIVSAGEACFGRDRRSVGKRQAIFQCVRANGNDGLGHGLRLPAGRGDSDDWPANCQHKGLTFSVPN